MSDLLAFLFSVFAGVVFAASVTGTAFVFRRRISPATKRLAITAGLWVTSMFLIVLFQNLVSKENAQVLVPALLIGITLFAAGSGIRLVRRVLKFEPEVES